ncbi:hypothetical protein Tco_1243172 [Tanacetum coccineum]
MICFSFSSHSDEDGLWFEIDGFVCDDEFVEFVVVGLSLTRLPLPCYDPCTVERKWLAHGVPLAVDDPVQAALAYREKMIYFYFQHKMFCP